MTITLKTTASLALCAASWIALVPSVASAQTAGSASADPATRPVVHVGLFRVQPDGRIGGSASQTADAAGEDITGVVYMAPCATLGASSSNLPVAASATDVWQLSGRVLTLTNTQASLQLTWQRVRRDGQDVAAPPQSVTLTLGPGERTTLDTVTLPALGACEERSTRLDVVLGSRPEGYGSGGFGGSGGGGGGVGRASGQGGAAGAGGGGGAVFIGSGGSTSGMAALSTRNTVADLWLVHAAPGAADGTLHTSVASVFALPKPFTFAPLTIRTSSGVFTVTVQGTIESGYTPEGQHRLYFSASRSVTFAPAGRPARDTAPVTEGSTKTSLPFPKADEVLSFEMPPLRVPGGSALPDRLSIRVRLTPPAGNPGPR